MQNHNIKKKTHPLYLLFTGDGKGKSSAAMGLVFRSLGHDASLAVIQFIKSEYLKTGEKKMALSLGVVWENYGFGFIRTDQEKLKAQKEVAKGFQRVKELILSHSYDLIVLDEFTYTLTLELLPLEEVISFFTSLKEDPLRPHIVFTGRNAPPSLVEICDLVSSIEEIKHPFESTNIKAQPLIEF